MLQQKWKKGILILGLSLGAALASAADKVEVFVSPNPVQVGIEARLVIRSNDGTANRIRSSLPKIDGLRAIVSLAAAPAALVVVLQAIASYRMLKNDASVKR